jgi:hypothetical protein
MGEVGGEQLRGARTSEPRARGRLAEAGPIWRAPPVPMCRRLLHPDPCALLPSPGQPRRAGSDAGPHDARGPRPARGRHAAQQRSSAEQPGGFAPVRPFPALLRPRRRRVADQASLAWSGRSAWC